MEEIKIYEISYLYDTENQAYVGSEQKTIYKGIKFSFQVLGLDINKKYIANLCYYNTSCTGTITTIFTCTESTTNNGHIIFIWSPKSTLEMPSNIVLSLEIYSEERDILYKKDDFAKVIPTSIGG